MKNIMMNTGFPFVQVRLPGEPANGTFNVPTPEADFSKKNCSKVVSRL